MTTLREKLALALGEKHLGRVGHGLAFANQYADLVLATIEESGMVIVPREATEEMVEAFKRSASAMAGSDVGENEGIAILCAAMLAAAPKEG